MGESVDHFPFYQKKGHGVRTPIHVIQQNLVKKTFHYHGKFETLSKGKVRQACVHLARLWPSVRLVLKSFIQKKIIGNVFLLD